MPKIVERIGGDMVIVRMRRNFSLTVSWDDRKAWAVIEQFNTDAARFDCRVMGTNKRGHKPWLTPRLYERVHGGDPLAFREVMLRQNGRGSLINSILIDHNRPARS